MRKRRCGCHVASSRIESGSKIQGGINQPCHGFLGGVTGHGDVMSNPQIVPIYWDQYFTDNPSAVSSMDKFLIDLATGNYWDGLIQYGVGKASFLGGVVIDMTSFPTPNSQNPGQPFSEVDLENQLRVWLDQGVVGPQPASAERNLIYLIFAPTDTTLSIDGQTNGFCGYHQHGRYPQIPQIPPDSPTDFFAVDNLIWCVVQGYKKAATGKAFVDFISFCVTHELTEAFTNPAGQGWFNDSNGCEIGDICEVTGSLGDLMDGNHRFWIGDFTGSGQSQVLFYYSSDGNWWLGSMMGPRMDWTRVAESAGFGNLLDGNHIFWVDDFKGAGTSQVLFYSIADASWWLGSMWAMKLEWTLVSQRDFGNLMDPNHMVWIGDFTNSARSQMLFYFNDDASWWLGRMSGENLTWTLVSQAGFGNLMDGNHRFWVDNFSSSSQSQVLFYYNGDASWWLGSMGGETLNWVLVDQTNFGNLLDGNHMFWADDFNGSGTSQLLFYYNGDGSWWLGSLAGDGQTLNWTLASNTDFGNLMDSNQVMFWVGNFSSASQSQLLFYYNGDSSWWLGSLAGDGQTLNWTLASDTDFGNLMDGNHVFWLADFAFPGQSQVLFYSGNDGNWWLGDMELGSWTPVNQQNDFGNLMDGNHMWWTADFNGSGKPQLLLYYNDDGFWWLGNVSGGVEKEQLNWTLVAQTAGTTFTVLYMMTWLVETYWSNLDGKCISGPSLKT